MESSSDAKCKPVPRHKKFKIVEGTDLSYNRGQQQRLCLARGLAVEPEVILGDEPTSALDPISAERIEQRFLKLKNKYTIVLVTHILRQAKRLADYVIFLYLGNLIECGPADDFFNNPKDAKTQAYLNGRFIEEYKVDK